MTDLTLSHYQREAGCTAVYPEADSGSKAAIDYAAMGLAGEVGEVLGELSKVWRDDHGVISVERRRKLKKELGDCCWFLARLAAELGFTLQDIAQSNLDKLSDRQKRGVLNGSGDNR